MAEVIVVLAVWAFGKAAPSLVTLEKIEKGTGIPISEWLA